MLTSGLVRATIIRTKFSNTVYNLMFISYLFLLVFSLVLVVSYLEGLNPRWAVRMSYEGK